MSDTLSLDQLEQLLETLDPSEIRARYADALAANPRCDAMLRHFEQMDEKLEALADAEPAPALPDFSAVQAERTAAEATVVPPRRRRLRWLVAAGPIAAALVVALLIGNFWRGENDLLRVPVASESAAARVDQEETSPSSVREEAGLTVDETLVVRHESDLSHTTYQLSGQQSKLEDALEEQRAKNEDGFAAEEGGRLEAKPATPAAQPRNSRATGSLAKDDEPEAKMDREQHTRSADLGAGEAAPAVLKPTGAATDTRRQNETVVQSVSRVAGKAKKALDEPMPAKETQPKQNERDGAGLLADRDAPKPAEPPLVEATSIETTLAEAPAQDVLEEDNAETEALLVDEAGSVAKKEVVEQQRLAEVAEAEVQAPGYQAAASPRLAQKQIALQGIEEEILVVGASRKKRSPRRADSEEAAIGPLAQLLLTADAGNRSAVAKLDETRARRLTELENAWQTSETAPDNLVTGGRVFWPVLDSKPLAFEAWQQAWRAAALASRPAVWIYPHRWRGDRRLVARLVVGDQTHHVLILFRADSIELRRP